MREFSTTEVKEARGPIGSLISKSEKAQRRVGVGTWQYRMLGENLRALRVGLALMEGEAVEGLGGEEWEGVVAALGGMIGRTEKAQRGFVAGMAQHSLLRNRLRALRVAEAVVVGKMARGTFNTKDTKSAKDHEESGC